MKNTAIKLFLITGIIMGTLTSCSRAPVQPTSDSSGTSAGGDVNASGYIKYDFKPGEITQICASQMKLTDQRLADLLKTPADQRHFSNFIVSFEQILADLNEITSGPTFMYYVSTNKNIRSEAEQCEAQLGQYLVGVMSRRDLYDAIVAADKHTPHKKMVQADKRLTEETIKAFKQNGLYLPDDQLNKVKELRQKLTTLETEYASNLNEDTTSVEMSAEDLEGVPDSMISRLTKLPDGKYKVSTKSTDYAPFMENAKHSDARRRMLEAYENRAADKNTKLLQEAVELRGQIAKLLKFKTWADYRTQDRMAKNAKTVMDFLNSLTVKLALKNRQDLAKLVKLKKEMEPGDKVFHAWDGGYYANQLKKKDYAVDDEAIREYFPSNDVVKKMFSIYSQMLGVKFVPVPDAKVWAPEVKLYEIHDQSDNRLIGWFYTDFVPRDGKYGHAAAFPLRPARMVDGVYRKPVSAIVANFNPPANGKPSLLNHDEVETLFHEFGHIMHQTLTTAPYATLSGSSVAQDFVEAPSQMLENWVWDPEMLKIISGSYKDPNKKLPDDLIKQLVRTRDFNQGYYYTRQLLYSLYDMDLHTSHKKLDVTQDYKRLYKKLTTIDALSDTHFPASFGHLMGGYDAGYYGYLWSEVFAQDMFTKFQKAGLLNPQMGDRYRRVILEEGDVYPADVLLVKFLGRKPNNKAFFKRLGIQ